MLFSKVLLAYDGSDASNKALLKAAELVKTSSSSQLEVVTAFDFPRIFMGEGLAPIPASINKEYYDFTEQTTEEVKSGLLSKV